MPYHVKKTTRLRPGGTAAKGSHFSAGSLLLNIFAAFATLMGASASRRPLSSSQPSSSELQDAEQAISEDDAAMAVLPEHEPSVDV